MPQELQIENGGERLDKYLSNRFPEHSRAWIQKAVKEGQVLVNGKTVTPHLRLKTGDRVRVTLTARPPIDLSPDPNIPLEVVDETTDYVVVQKPAGIVAHPAEGVRSGTLVNGLLARYSQLSGVGDDPLRPGIVHRLDREASGLMIVALTQTAFEYFKQQFRQHHVEKHYTALVYGSGLPAEGSINFSIIRSEKGRMASVPPDQPGSRSALTEYEVLERFQHYTLVGVRTHTGRTHQVRVHFHGIGHPLVGDHIYRISQFAKLWQSDQLFLCADRLAFTDPAGERKEYAISLPEEWRLKFDKLR